MNEALKYLEKEIKDLEIKLEKDIKLRDKLTIYQHNALENCVGRISKYESKLKQLNTIKQSLIKTQELEEENVKLKQSEKLLIAKKSGFFDGYGMWRDEDFVIDYDTIRKEFCLRSITMGYGLGRTRFYESDYKKTWWLKESKEE